MVRYYIINMLYMHYIFHIYYYHVLIYIDRYYNLTDFLFLYIPNVYSFEMSFKLEFLFYFLFFLLYKNMLKLHYVSYSIQHLRF